ncbi:ATP phosphoribosyltransferase regulatory subunit [Aquibacillus sediminis]|uniref:ATP phosphoribosyltransferase regulatory subunit n=1 Tax=Aquibacillus sediminis TaxID=2574734 RepID=UPI001107CC61|nr:ATP phosphoribosyltransferase regulatory subunit [Aquibacillus sediminis]
MFLPSGSQDEIGQKITNRSKAYEIFKNVTLSRNYKQITTPVVEYATTFTNKYAGMELRNMLKWFNHEGDIEVLRPDWTTAVARAVGNQNNSQSKWAYQGSVFRRDKDGMESRQAGIEIVHMPTFLGESECLLTAAAYLNELNINDYLVELGHIGIFNELIAPLNLTEQQIDQLRNAMHDKRRDDVYQIVANAGRKDIAEELTSLVDAYGTSAMIEEYEEKWQHNQQLLSIIQHLKRLANLLEQLNVEVIVDLGRVKNLPYYDGTMFRGYIKSNGATCFSGGRYNRLYEQFEQNISAVGLAFDVDVLAEHIEEADDRIKVCILASEDTHAFAEKHRNNYPNAIVDIQYQRINLDRFDKVIEVVEENAQLKVVEK